MKFNILIVEDHALTRFALMTSLNDADFVQKVFEADCAKSAYEIISKNKINLVLLDLGLPVVDGVSAAFEIKKKHPDIKIVVVTSHLDKKEVDKCLDAGVSAYCSKDINPDKLIEVIRDVLNGSMWFDSSVCDFVYQKMSGFKPNSDTENKYNLTSKELSVLKLLADGNSNNEIAKKLNISINTTKVHMCAILQKLSVDDRTQAAIKAIRENLT